MAKSCFLIVSFLFFSGVAVQAQYYFQDSEDQASVTSESGFSNDLGVSLPAMEFPIEPNTNSERTSLSFDQESEQETDSPYEFREESHPDEASDFPESEFHQASVDETAEPLKTRYTPPPLPSPPKAPYPPKSPQITCARNCDTKCATKKIPVLHGLCTKICRQKCMLVYVQAIYKCTSSCADSMPRNFEYAKEKSTGYVKYCYNKCISKVI